MSVDLRTQITAALAACADGDLTANCIHLLDVLGYRSEKRFVLAPNSAQNFAATFGSERPLHAMQARIDEWTEANVLFQLTDSEVAQTGQLHLLREDGGWDRGVYRSFLFLAIGLAGEAYSRTPLATITRAVNRLFMMPTPIFFCYGDKLTLAIILRAHCRSNIHLYPDDWKALPIPDIPLEAQQPLVALVDEILTCKAQDPAADVSALEAEIDALVYRLYGLTAEEIKIVEGR